MQTGGPAKGRPFPVQRWPYQLRASDTKSRITSRGA
jgi:hypothetical protein